MTVKAKFRFVVKANTDVTPWIAFEPLNIHLRDEGLPAGIFGFDLPHRTSGERAEQIANFLNKNLGNFKCQWADSGSLWGYRAGFSSGTRCGHRTGLLRVETCAR